MTDVSQDWLLSPHLALNGIFTGTGAGAGLAGLLAPEDLESEEGVGSAPVLPGLEWRSVYNNNVIWTLNIEVVFSRVDEFGIHNTAMGNYNSQNMKIRSFCVSNMNVKQILKKLKTKILRVSNHKESCFITLLVVYWSFHNYWGISVSTDQ